MPNDAPGGPLHGMFAALPPHYDLVNRIITLGFDRRWRREAARTCLASHPVRILDLGCGTGDLAIAIARRDKAPEVVGLDYSLPMLEIARRKAEGLKVNFTHGNAANLVFADSYFDCVGISFAFRNLTYRNPLMERALAEVLRVLRPGGRFVIVESSQPGSKFIRWLFHLYLRGFVYAVGRLLSGNRGAYRYLVESAARFYAPDEVRRLLLDAGFAEVAYRPLLLGVAGIHVAVKAGG